MQILNALSLFLFAAATVGSLAIVVQLVIVLHFRSKQPQSSAHAPAFSILKPLCGVDDALEANLESFAALDYPEFEVLLGVKDERDKAFAFARSMVERHPDVFRLVLQRGAPGMNPKVNQLITLSQAAKHELVVISDSNTRVPEGYLRELAGHFEDEAVCCVTHPIVGCGERTLGALLDNVHLASSIGAAMIAAPAISGSYLVVGKSMALRASTLRTLGGFEAFKDFLAEDYVIGRALMDRGLQIRVARLPVLNVATDKSVGDFWARYARWSVIHRTAVERSTYFAQALMNPAPLALLGVLLAPSQAAAVLFAAIAALKCVVDVATTRALRDGPLPAGTWLTVLLKDGLLFAAWVRGLFSRTVIWRGNRLTVAQGSRLISQSDTGPQLEQQDVPSSLAHH